MNKPADNRLIALLALLGASLLWGSSFIAMKIAVTNFDPIIVVWGRMTLASVALLFGIRHFRHVRYQKGDWKLLLLMALFEPCLYFVFEAYALRLTSSSQAGMVTAILPLLVALGAKAFLAEKVTRKTLAGFALSIVGVSWLTLAAQATESAPQPLLGNFLEFMAMCCAAGYMLIMKHLTFRYSPLFITAVQAIGGAIFFTPGLLLPQVTFPTELPLLPLAMVVYLGLVITIGGYGLYNFGTSRIPASQASAFVNLIPVIAVVFGWLFLGETFTPAQYAAAALVLAGVFVCQDKTAGNTGNQEP